MIKIAKLTQKTRWSHSSANLWLKRLKKQTIFSLLKLKLREGPAFGPDQTLEMVVALEFFEMNDHMTSICLNPAFGPARTNEIGP